MITILSDGTVKFELFLPRANSVHVTGTFNGWSKTSHPMQRLRDGWWGGEIRLPLGEHLFQYLIDNREWMADFAAHGVELNGYGCWVSQLRVEAPRRVRRTTEGTLPEPFVKPAVRTGPMPPVAPARTAVAANRPSVTRGPSTRVSANPSPRTNRDAERGHHSSHSAPSAAKTGHGTASRSAKSARTATTDGTGEEGGASLAQVLTLRVGQSSLHPRRRRGKTSGTPHAGPDGTASASNTMP